MHPADTHPAETGSADTDPDLVDTDSAGHGQDNTDLASADTQAGSADIDPVGIYSSSINMWGYDVENLFQPSASKFFNFIPPHIVSQVEARVCNVVCMSKGRG